jgi:hypothetical protein
MRCQVCREGYSRTSGRCTPCVGSTPAGLGGELALAALAAVLLLLAVRGRRRRLAAGLPQSLGLSERISPGDQVTRPNLQQR